MRLFALLLVPGLAFATNPPSNQPQNQSQHQGQDQHQSQGQAQAQRSDASASASNGLNYAVEDRLQIPAAPAVFAPSMSPSHPCALTNSKGFSVWAGGATKGESVTEPNCDRREAARVLAPLNPGLALKVMCSDPYVAAVATPEDCIYVPAGTITKADLDRVESESKARDDAVFRQSQKK